MLFRSIFFFWFGAGAEASSGVGSITVGTAASSVTGQKGTILEVDNTSGVLLVGDAIGIKTSLYGADGDATFAGNVVANHVAVGDNPYWGAGIGAYMNGSNGAIVSANSTGTANLWNGFQGPGAHTSKITAAGAATFTSTVTASAYYGDGSNLTGIDATAIQTGTTKVDTNTSTIENVISGTTRGTFSSAGLTVVGSYYARTSNDSTSGNTHGFVCNSSDGAYRHYSVANAQTLMNVPTRTGGNASGTWNITAAFASKVYATSTNNNTAYYPTFVSGGGAFRDVFVDSNYSYNPSNNTLSAGSFSGSHTGNGASLTNLNASNITTGTISSSRVPTLNQNTTGSSASCTGNSSTATWTNQVDVHNGNDSNGSYYMVWHSGDQVYSTNGIYCNPYYDRLYATYFSGNGDSLTNLNASNISSGTIPAARLPNHSAGLLTSGTIPAARLPNHSAGLLTSGTISASRLPNHSAGLLTSG